MSTAIARPKKQSLPLSHRDYKTLGLEVMSDMLSGLISIRDSKKSSTYGICTSLRVYMTERGYENIPWTYMKAIFQKWPHFSDDVWYPIPAVTQSSPMSEYLACNNRWSKRTKYGRLRWDLLEFMIDRIRKDIRNMKRRISRAKQP